MAKGSMREQMPVVTAWIDDMRKAFGEAYINNIIVAGIRGQAVFSASENGHQVGTPVKAGTRVIRDEKGNHTIVVRPDGTSFKHNGD